MTKAMMLHLLAALLAVTTAAQHQAVADARVYGSDIHDPADTGGGGGPPAIAISGTRNGSFSGKVMVSSSQPIQGLKATVGDLRCADATIPASRISIRYGVPWDTSIGSHQRPRGGDILLDSAPAEVPPGRGGKAAVPVWVTVAVPKDTRPGAYTGTLSVKVAGREVAAVPVKLDVQDWTLPDTGAYRTWVELIQSPDTLAAEYGIPLWSDRHWEMIARSMDFIGRTGSRVVHVPLICHTNYGNQQSMVRWIAKGEGRYEYDFSVMDRYLDLAEKHMGKPKIVVFYAWEVYLKPPKEEVVVKEDDSKYVRMEKSKKAARWALRGKGPAVTTLDPATGSTGTIYLPPYADPSSKALWQPLWTELRKRMQKRGLGEAMMLGVVSDLRPTREEVTFLKGVSGDLPWASCSHHARWLFRPKDAAKGELYGLASIGYTAVALDFQYTLNPAKGRSYGWKKPALHGQYWRFSYFNNATHSKLRHEAECNITGNQRGLAHIGADFWFAMKDKRDRRRGTVAERYPQSYWHSLNIGGWLLGPGPDGPAGTARLEVFREGLQECEARIAIETALTDDALKAKLGPQLASRAQNVLDERHVAMWKARGAPEADLQHGLVERYRDMYGMWKKWNGEAGNTWFLQSDWQGRTAQLYTVAGEVEKALSAR